MSNDLRFWVVRITLFALIGLDSFILLSSLSNILMSPESYSKGRIILAFLLIILTIPLAVYYYALKAARWNSMGQEAQNKIAVETLASLGKKNQK